MKAECLDRILFNYKVLYVLWEESLDYVKETDMRSRIIGVQTCMRSFDFLFRAMLGELLLRHTDNLSKTLQSPGISAADGQVVAGRTVKTIQSLRTDENFVLFWTKVEQVDNDVDVEYPLLPRKRKAPKWYDSGSCGSDPPASVQDYYRPIFFEVIDLICCSIQTRFDQLGFQVSQGIKWVKSSFDFTKDQNPL